MPRRIRTGLALAGAAVVTAVFVPAVYVCLRFEWGAHRTLPPLWHRTMARFLGLRVRVHGEIRPQRPLLLVANHVSWSDIVVLGTVGYVSFIAKSDMASWPVFGMLAKLQKSIFVEREKRADSRRQAEEIADRLAGGDVMVLFAEGGTSDGNTVLPFKSSLFGAAAMAARKATGGEVLVQPVSIAYVRLHGMPMGRQHRGIAAWVGDIGMVAHLAGVLREGAIDVEISFGEPAILSASGDRKAVTRLMEARVRRMMADSLRGADRGDVTPGSFQ